MTHDSDFHRPPAEPQIWSSTQPYAHTPAPQRKGMSNYQIVVLVLLGLVVLGLFTCTGALVLVWMAIDGGGDFLEPQNVDVMVIAPESVAPDTPFVIEATVTNTGPETQTIHEIDIYNDYLAGIRVTGSDPPYRGVENSFGITTYRYRIDIPPGETAVVRINAVGKQLGEFAGDLNVCINNMMTYTTYYLFTEVTNNPISTAPTSDPPTPAPQ